MNCKTNRRINGYCQSIDFIKQILTDNEILYEEKNGEVIIISPLAAGTQYNIDRLFYCANVPLAKFEYGAENHITYYELDINQIKKDEVCGKSKQIHPRNFGNGMLYQIEGQTNTIFLVLNHNYIADEIIVKDVSGILKEDCILCEDVLLPKGENIGKCESIFDVSNLNLKSNFCGYVKPKYYEQQVGEMEKKSKHEYMHDFQKFQNQKDEITLI